MILKVFEIILNIKKIKGLCETARIIKNRIM
jgi:hypothetical protein